MDLHRPVSVVLDVVRVPRAAVSSARPRQFVLRQIVHGLPARCMSWPHRRWTAGLPRPGSSPERTAEPTGPSRWCGVIGTHGWSDRPTPLIGPVGRESVADRGSLPTPNEQTRQHAVTALQAL